MQVATHPQRIVYFLTAKIAKLEMILISSSVRYRSTEKIHQGFLSLSLFHRSCRSGSCCKSWRLFSWPLTNRVTIFAGSLFPSSLSRPLAGRIKSAWGFALRGPPRLFSSPCHHLLSFNLTLFEFNPIIYCS